MPKLPPLPVLAKYAELDIIIDRPFDAEKICRLLVQLDPKNPEYQGLLKRALVSERPTLQTLIHNYRDTIQNRLFTYGTGIIFRTPYGRATISAGTGYYGQHIINGYPNQTLGFLASDLDGNLDKSTINLILEPYSGLWEGYIFLNKTYFAGAPNVSLFNLRASYVPIPGREKFTVFYMRNDSFIQSDQLQFFSPETYWAVVEGLTEDITGTQIDYPLNRKLDFETQYQYLAYSDGNTRNLIRSQLMYRLMPKANEVSPVFRVGIQHVYDNTRKFAVYYFTPQDYQAFSVASDFLVLSKRLTFGLFGTLPFAKVPGYNFGKYSPLATLFTFANYRLTDRLELWVKLTSAKKTVNAAAFTDFVFGVNQRF